MSLVIYDSVKKQKVNFEPIENNSVKVYVCGPTVYDDAHLGHARSAIAFDLLHRVLLLNGYKVDMAKNFTDIDDKILKKMESENKSLEEITSYYIDRYKEDMDALNILPNSIEPKATQNLQAMIDMISNLLDKGFAYIIDDGVYFEVSKDQAYGSLSHQISEDTQARVEEKKGKKDQKDYALWKFTKDEEVGFEAPFGKGRPGWHIECSAMIDKHLASSSSEYSIDIHAGGADLLFPHHENEASQSRCATGKNLAKYWMHNGFVNIDGSKMSKSLGNSFFLKDALKEYHGEVIRFYMSATHYRSDFNFNEEDLNASKKRLDKLYRLKKRVYGLGSSAVNKDFKARIVEALNDDINISLTLSIVDEFLANANESLDKEPKNKGLKKEIVSNLEFISTTLGIGNEDPYKYFQFGINEDEISKIEELINKRAEAKANKDFEKADQLRDEILSLDVQIMDTPNGTLWEKI